MDASLTNLNKLTIARQVRAFRARPANTGVRHDTAERSAPNTSG